MSEWTPQSGRGKEAAQLPDYPDPARLVPETLAEPPSDLPPAIVNFLLEEEASEPAVFVAVGDGLASIKSLVEQAIAIDNAAALHLFRIDDAPSGGQLDNLCRSWNDALDNFSYHRLDPGVGPAQAARSIDDALMDLAGHRLYVAGSAAWLDGFIEHLIRLGVPAGNIRADRIDATGVRCISADI